MVTEKQMRAENQLLREAVVRLSQHMLEEIQRGEDEHGPDAEVPQELMRKATAAKQLLETCAAMGTVLEWATAPDQVPSPVEIVATAAKVLMAETAKEKMKAADKLFEMYHEVQGLNASEFGLSSLSDNDKPN